jgi:putative endonuclease
VGDDGRAVGGRTVRQRHGEAGERLAAAHLASLGWSILAQHVRVGRDEIDLVARDPGPPAMVVVVEVRARSTSAFGTPEESVDRRKVARLYRAAAALRALGSLPNATPLPRLAWRVDLLAIDDGPVIGPGAGGPAIRHLRAIEVG